MDTTTGEAIRNFCKQCINSSQKKDLQNCGGEYVLVTKKPCALLKYRLKGKGTLGAIRKNCVECQGGNALMVRYCLTEDCPLYDFRMGAHPRKIGGPGRLENLKNAGKVVI